MSGVSCSDQSCAVGEALAGTAAEAERWLLLEYADEWKPKAYEQAQLPTATRDAIDAAVRANPKLRVQLIRRAERRASETTVTLLLAACARGDEQLWELNLPSLDAIAELPLTAWATGSEPLAYARRSAPLYLVCVHGKRDRCCAQKGMPVYRELARVRPQQTWQTTHLGGHRFAATLVALPSGVCFGRVEASEVPALVAQLEARRIYQLDRYRGRCCDSAQVQAAESSFRLARGLTSLEDVVPVVAGASDEAGVRLRAADGSEQLVRVVTEPVGAIQQSCDAPDTKPAVRLRLL